MFGSVLCRVLPAAHALTGCDTTSSIFDVGKKTMYKVLKDSQKEFVDLSQTACDDIETYVAVDRKFVARLYDPKARFACDHGDLNKLRSRIAQQKDASLVKLPPCEATFRQHVLRVSLQVYIWTSSSIAQPPVRSPLQFGWVNKNGLVLVYFDEQTSSDFYVLVRGKLCVQKVVFVLNKTSLVRNSVPVKEISLATTPIRTLLQTTVMKKLIHTIFVIKYDSSCFPIVTVWFLFVWVFLTECSTYDLESGFVET